MEESFMKMGKKVAVLGAAVMLTFNMSIGASAQDTHKLRKTTTNYKWYTYEWERTLTCLNGDDEIGIMVYGFDMDWINEDYTWTIGYDCRTKACVKKGSDESGAWAGYEDPYDWSKQEVHHTDSKVMHYIKFEDSYAELTAGSVKKSEYKNPK